MNPLAIPFADFRHTYEIVTDNDVNIFFINNTWNSQFMRYLRIFFDYAFATCVRVYTEVNLYSNIDRKNDLSALFISSTHPYRYANSSLVTMILYDAEDLNI